MNRDYLLRQKTAERFVATGASDGRRVLLADASWNPVYVPLELACNGGSQYLPMGVVHMLHDVSHQHGMFHVGFLDEPVRLLIYSFKETLYAVAK